MSLTISRYIGERLCLETPAGPVWVEIGNIYLHGRPAWHRKLQVRLRIEAPPAIKITREELVPQQAPPAK